MVCECKGRGCRCSESLGRGSPLHSTSVALPEVGAPRLLSTGLSVISSRGKQRSISASLGGAVQDSSGPAILRPGPSIQLSQNSSKKAPLSILDALPTSTPEAGASARLASQSMSAALTILDGRMERQGSTLGEEVQCSGYAVLSIPGFSATVQRSGEGTPLDALKRDLLMQAKVEAQRQAGAYAQALMARHYVQCGRCSVANLNTGLRHEKPCYPRWAYQTPDSECTIVEFDSVEIPFVLPPLPGPRLPPAVRPLAKAARPSPFDVHVTYLASLTATCTFPVSYALARCYCRAEGWSEGYPNPAEDMTRFRD